VPAGPKWMISGVAAMPSWTHGTCPHALTATFALPADHHTRNEGYKLSLVCVVVKKV